MKKGGRMDAMNEIGAMGGDMIILAAIIAFAIFGVFKYMRAETNAYNQTQELIKDVDYRTKATADEVTKMADSVRVLTNRLSNLEKRLDDANESIAGNDYEIQQVQDHAARLSKSVNKIDHSPRYVTLVADPDKPLPIVVKKQVRKKKTVTRSKKKRTPSGIVSITESNTVPLKGKVTDFSVVKKKRVKKKVTKKKKKTSSRRSRAN